MLIAPILTAGPTPDNRWFAPRRSAKHANNNVSVEPGLAPARSVSIDSSTNPVPTNADQHPTAQGLVKWSSRRSYGSIIIYKNRGIVGGGANRLHRDCASCLHRYTAIHFGKSIRFQETAMALTV